MQQKTAGKKIYEDEFVSFHVDTIKHQNNDNGTYSYIKRKDGVCAVVVSESDEFLLINQYRYPIGQNSWEIPGGGLENPKELAQELMRELKEETGVEKSDIHTIDPLTKYHPLASANTEVVHIFKAIVKKQPVTIKHADAEEAIVEARWFTQSEVEKMIKNGTITDAVTIAALLHTIYLQE